MKSANFSWYEDVSGGLDDEKLVLKNIDIILRRNELVGVCGPVGAGKSSLIYAILGEINCVSGYVDIKTNRIAYVPQSSWIQNGTVKSNIVFGQQYRKEWFDEVLRACALDRDLAMMPDHENTIIGEKGIALSGGQMARICLARAVYADADIYLLDDPLSAVDPQVGK